MKTSLSTMTPMAVAMICLVGAGWAQEALVQVAPPEGAIPGAAGYGTGYGIATVKTKSRESVPPVVIQFSTTDRTVVEAMEEDLAVMTRLLEKALDGGLGEEQAMGIPLLVTRGGRSVRALQVEGLGAVFMIKVNFPLLPPPKAEEPKPEASATSEWESAKKEIDGQDVRTEERWVGATPGGGDYDEEQVEVMKKTLLLALKQASNMKHLQPDDSVIVSVFGSPNSGRPGPGTASVGKSRNAGLALPTSKPPKPAAPDVPGEANAFAPPTTQPPKVARARAPGAAAQEVWTSDGRVITRISAPNGRAVGQGTVVTLRVKKSDVDAFAKGTLTLEAFQKRAAVNAYVGSGQGITSVNSWIGTRF